MRDLADLVERIESPHAVVCVVGQGYVGLTVAASAAEAGFTVHAVDLAVDRITDLSRGVNVVPGVSDDLFERGVKDGRLTFTTSFEEVPNADVVLICVPTPLVDHRPDLSYIEKAAAQVAERLRPGTLVVLESTTYAGTTEDVVRPILEGSGLVCTADFALAYSPERVDPGNQVHDFRATPRIVGGVDELATSAAAAFYRRVVDEVHTLSSCRAAELAKLLENTFRMVNIALVNELAVLCADQGISVWEVIDAAATKPFGFMPFHPGPGVGGHCIPLDPTYLSWQAHRDTGRRMHLVETAQDVNDQMPAYVTTRIVEALNDRSLSVKGARLLALGVTYKPDVGDVRESAALEVLSRLARKGAELTYFDPFVDEITHRDLQLTCSPLTAETVADADAVLLLTPHSSLDLDMIVSRARLVFDARNAIRRPSAAHVIAL